MMMSNLKYVRVPDGVDNNRTLLWGCWIKLREIGYTIISGSGTTSNGDQREFEVS